jgi:2-oxoglutarate ferredoxin oxidoreductase subunit beta
MSCAKSWRKEKVMFDPIEVRSPTVLDLDEDEHSLDEYEGRLSRWCHGCGNNAILTAMQKLCAEEQLAPEKTVFVSGIGCASRLPHYMGTYGFHGLHGRALPIAEGIKIRRPDLHVFVNTGDGDCCSIGAAHWIHAVRYNMNITVVLHDNEIYGLTKKQASPTSPRGLVSNTTPRGATIGPLNPLQATLGMSNVSFVAHAVDWLPSVLYQIIHQAYQHRGTAFVCVMQRCPNYLPDHFDGFVRHPDNVRLLTHPRGLEVEPALAARFKNNEEHDPSNLDRARELAADREHVPLGILYRDETVPCYEDVHAAAGRLSAEEKLAALDRELERFTIAPTPADAPASHPE